MDLEGTGYEFLLDQNLGHGLSFLEEPTGGATGPAIGSPGFMNGNGPTGTDDAFDIYLPDFTYNGTWYFGGYPIWATWSAELFGTEGAGDMTFYGVGARGNDAGLYTTGSFACGPSLRFLLRKNGLPLGGHLCASLGPANFYAGGPFDVTRLLGGLIACFPRAMDDDPIGDFCAIDIDLPPQAGGITIYLQGFLGDAPLLQPPMDASNGLRAN